MAVGVWPIKLPLFFSHFWHAETFLKGLYNNFCNLLTFLVYLIMWRQCIILFATHLKNRKTKHIIEAGEIRGLERNSYIESNEIHQRYTYCKSWMSYISALSYLYRRSWLFYCSIPVLLCVLQLKFEISFYILDTSTDYILWIVWSNFVA